MVFQFLECHCRECFARRGQFSERSGRRDTTETMMKWLLRITKRAVAFATLAHMMMDLGVVEPWPYLGLHWWIRTAKGMLGMWIGIFFWEVMTDSLRPERGSQSQWADARG